MQSLARMPYSIDMRAIVEYAQQGWIIAWAVSLVLLRQQSHWTTFLLESLLLMLLLSLLVFVVPRTLARLALAVAAFIGKVTSKQFFPRAIHRPKQRTRFSDVPVRFLRLQLPPPSCS